MHYGYDLIMTKAYLITESASLNFPLYSADRRSIKSLLRGAIPGARIGLRGDGEVSVEALRNINLNLEGGDRLALVGPNGAGKTTLLKLLAGIYYPTFGEIRRSGSVTTLFNIGLGLDMNATGIENIYLANYLHGMSRSHIKTFVEDVIEFSDLGQFIYMPVRTYSSGMLTRLAFAIATAFSPDILLIDEIFGTGDAKFVSKSSIRMENLMKKARILVFASHNNSLIKKLCNKALLIREGKEVALGGVDEILQLHAKES